MDQNSSSSDIDEELQEHLHDPAEADAMQESSLNSSSTRKKGRPRIPERWTRVVSFADDDLSSIKIPG